MHSLQKRGLTAMLLIVVWMGLSQSAQANGRATKEQMAQRARESESLWDAPGSNYAAISSIFIKPGTTPREDMLKRLTSGLEKTGSAQERAALNYLIGETYYWGGLAELRKTRDRSVLLGLGDNAVAAYLAAWTSVTNAGPGTAAMKQLRQTIASRLNQVLSTEVCSATLSTNLKQQVVVRYIDGMGAAEQSDSTLSPALRSKVYTNLGILGRLVEKIPTSMPTNFLAVCEAMELAVSVGATNEALRFAAHLESSYDKDLDKTPIRRRQVFAVYRDCHDPCAVPCLKALAAVEPEGWLEFYDYSVRLDHLFPVEQRRKCLDEYFKGLDTKKAKGVLAYRVALERLVANGDYDLAIEVSEAALAHKSAAGPSTERALVWRLKAVAHEKRGEKGKAEEASSKGLGDVTFLGRDELKSLFRSDAGPSTKHDGHGGEEK